MKWIHLALSSGNRARWSGSDLSHRKDLPSGILLKKRMGMMRAALVATAALSLISDCAFGQTTRTSTSASSTSKNIPSSSATSPNSPCSPTNPNSPCYSANAPRNPCYSAVTPNEPCSTTTTANSPTSTPATQVTATPRAPGHAFTTDQAKSQIEAEGYSDISGLKKDAKGIWRGKAVKDGSPVNVTLGSDGNVTAN
jgi:hypothetical protein